MTLPPEWSEFIGLLCGARVRFLIVGAHALAVHGRPRATGDLDLFVDATPENAARLAGALKAFGFAALARKTKELATPDRMVTLGRPPLRIDVMTSISGVSFAEAWRGRRTVHFGPHRVGVLGRAQFERNKRASGRPQDLLDLQLLGESTRKTRRSH
ncbi:MAG: hypothetical protein ABIR79_18980 [Candidatus Binatia bacterium]